ncbi:MAG: Ribonuclease P protein component [Phycisphaerae bacterium]|nr:Ribonuclease P protein component [Phycisphaerae bacterium]
MAETRDKPLRFRFPASMRIKRQGDFDRIYNARCSVADRILICYAAANALPHPRVGLSVSRKLGPAVVRNRFKRLLREAFRLARHDLQAGFDYILIPRTPEGPASLADYRRSVATLTAKAVARWARRQARDAGDEFDDGGC